MGRLNDTEAIVRVSLRNGDTSCPDAGEAQTSRRGPFADYWQEEGAEPKLRNTNAGVESGKAALGHLGRRPGRN